MNKQQHSLPTGAPRQAGAAGSVSGGAPVRLDSKDLFHKDQANLKLEEDVPNDTPATIRKAASPMKKLINISRPFASWRGRASGRARRGEAHRFP